MTDQTSRLFLVLLFVSGIGCTPSTLTEPTASENGNEAIVETTVNEYQFTAEEQAKIDKFIEKYGYRNDIKVTDRELFYWAIACENVDVVKFFISKGADVNAKAEDGETPLLAALRRNYGRSLQEMLGHVTYLPTPAGNESVEIVKILVSNGAVVQTKPEEGVALLAVGVMYNANVETIKFLVAQGIDINAKPEYAADLFRAAVGNDANIDLVKYLFDISKALDVNKEDKDGDTLLHVAAGSDTSVEIFDFLLSKGMEINTPNKAGRTPLHLAAVGSLGKHGAVHIWQPDIEVFKYLISKGADVHAKDNDGKTPLDVALAIVVLFDDLESVKWLVSQGTKFENVPTLLHGTVGSRNFTGFANLELTQFLVSGGADVNGRNGDGETPLHVVAHSPDIGTIKIAQFLVSKGADVNAKDKKGKTPLHEAACWSDIDGQVVEFIEFLISVGADIHAKNDYGETALHRAGSTEVAELFLDKGIAIDVKDNDGGTPLHAMADRGKYYVETAEFLISQGADVNAKDKKGKTPLHVASDVESAQLLVSKGADVNARDNEGKTPLHVPTRNYSNELGFEIVKFLVSQGADTNVKDNAGKTPLDVAKEKRNTMVVEYLESVTEKP